MSGPAIARPTDPEAAGGHPAPHAPGGLLGWIATTDHKRIGILYLVTSFAFLFFAGVLALVMRAELAQPGLQLVDEGGYNQLFTMHGTIMMFLFGTPVAAAFANYLVPLQVGAADMAFPRLNALSYWLYLFGGIIVLSGYLTSGGPADVGWTGYAPLSEPAYSVVTGTDLWIVGLALVGVSGILGALNFVVTIFARRMPGMGMLRMPIFTWNILVTGVLILFAFPSLTAALAMLYLDRRFGASFFDAAAGGSPILWQHLFWFFGHPEVYILILPVFGIISEVVPVFSRRPLFGYRAVILATIAIALLSMTVWAHHMFTTGLVALPFFSVLSFAIAVPTGIKIFNWLATMLGGRLLFEPPMLWAVGFVYLFVVGGITGVIVASPPLDFHLHDTYFVVAHLHNVLVSGTVFGVFAGVYFWFPKMTGRFLDTRLGAVHFWSWVVGFSLAFFSQYQLGASGMPRRIADYAAGAGWTDLNVVSTIGAVLLGIGLLPFLAAVGLALRSPATAPADPWAANSLEWAAASPPAGHNFEALPPIRSERPVFDARQAAQAEARKAAAREALAREERAPAGRRRRRSADAGPDDPAGPSGGARGGER